MGGDEQALGTAGSKRAQIHCASILCSLGSTLHPVAFLSVPVEELCLLWDCRVPGYAVSIPVTSELQLLSTPLSCDDLGF